MGCGASQHRDDPAAATEKAPAALAGSGVASEADSFLAGAVASKYVQYTCPTMLLQFRTGLSSNVGLFVRDILLGVATLARPAPSLPGDAQLHVRTDLCPSFTINVSEEELKQVAQQTRRELSVDTDAAAKQKKKSPLPRKDGGAGPGAWRAGGDSVSPTLSSGSAGNSGGANPLTLPNGLPVRDIGETKRQRAQRLHIEKLRQTERTEQKLELLTKRLIPTRIKSVSVELLWGGGTSIESVALSQDERLIAIALGSEFLRARKLPAVLVMQREPESAQSIPRPQSSGFAGWGPGGSTRLFHRQDGRLRFYDTRTAQIAAQILAPVGQHLRDIQFAPDALTLYSKDDNGVTMWDVIKKRPARTQLYAPRDERANEIYSCISPCGAYVAMVNVIDDVSPHISVMREGKIVFPFFGHETHPTAMCFSQHSLYIASSDSCGTVIVWSVADGQWICTVQLDPAHVPIVSIAFFADVFVVCSSTAIIAFGIEDPDDAAAGESAGLSSSNTTGDAGAGGEDSSPLTLTVAPRPSFTQPGARRSVSAKRDRPTKTARPLWLRTVDGTVHSVATIHDVQATLERMTFAATGGRQAFRFIHVMPGTALAVASNGKNVLLLDRASGDTIDTCETKAPPTSFHSGFQSGVVGDLWGNVYRIHFIQSSELPRY